MNRRKPDVALICIAMAVSIPAWGASAARQMVRQGNVLYAQQNFNEALNHYDQALTEDPKAIQAKFNKANCYLRLGDIEQAKTLYREVVMESKDMSLVEKSKYNLGNTLFQEGLKQRDANLQKSVDGLQDAIDQWQATLELNEGHPKAGRNIEVARLMIKDLMDQINKQQDPNQPRDPNQAQQQQQQNQEEQQQNQQQAQGAQDPNQTDSQEQQGEGEDPNEPDTSRDPNQPQPSQPENDPNQTQQQEPQPDPQQDIQQDMTAQRILDKEQRQNRERQQRRRLQHQKVKKDW